MSPELNWDWGAFVGLKYVSQSPVVHTVLETAII